MNYYDDEEDEDDDQETLYGTPLPPIDETTDVASLKRPEIDLTVRDEKGRRRFHGAFTGGFSAGYFNTVATPEGWVPSQFVSTRGEKWDRSLVHSKPEDFMDAEDLGQFGIAPRRIHTREKFVSADTEFAGLRATDDLKSMTDVLRDIIKPANESIGMRLFKAMKRGQRGREAQGEDDKTTKVYGCQLPEMASFDLKSDLEVEEEKFRMIFASVKNDQHGIGYKSELTDPSSAAGGSGGVTSGDISATLSGGRRLKITGEAFGYGALEEMEDRDDDAQVYTREDMSQYDFSILTPAERKAKKSNEIGASRGRGQGFDRDAHIEGFILAMAEKINQKLVVTRKYPPPVLPRDWKPRNPFEVISGASGKKRKSRWDQSEHGEPMQSGEHSRNLRAEGSAVKSNESKSESMDKKTTPVINANVRAILLGEEIVRMTGVKPKADVDLIANVAKTEESEEVDEKYEEQKARIAATPLMGFWGSKFTRSSEIVEESKLVGGLLKSSEKDKDKTEEKEKSETEEASLLGVVDRISYQWHPHNLLCRRFNVANPYPQFPDVVGVVTVGKNETVRNRTSLVTGNKKKNEPNLFSSLFEDRIESGPSGSDNRKESTSGEVEIEMEVSVKRNLGLPTTKIKVEDDEDESVNNEGTVVADKEEEVKRPPMDLFKAIFASDESESDDDDDDDDKEEIVSKSDEGKKAAKEPHEALTSVQQIKEKEMKPLKGPQFPAAAQPQREGVFANVDFDQLQKFNPVTKSAVPKKVIEPSSAQHQPELKEVVRISSDEDDIYGPALPPSQVEQSLQQQSVIVESKEQERESKRSLRKRKKKEKKSSKKLKKKLKKDMKKRRKGKHKEHKHSQHSHHSRQKHSPSPSSHSSSSSLSSDSDPDSQNHDDNDSVETKIMSLLKQHRG